DDQTKRRILSDIGSNLTLKAKRLSIDVKIPFRIIEDSLGTPPENPMPIEPEKDVAESRRSRLDNVNIPSGWSQPIDVRTYREKLNSMVRRLYRHYVEHPDELAPTLDDLPNREPWREAA